jgi:hypothetical protein
MIKRKSNKDMWRTFTVLSSLSLNLGFMVAGGYFLGRILETKYYLKNMSFIGVLVGLFLGFIEMFVIAYKMGTKK